MTLSSDPAGMRREYSGPELNPEALGSDPVAAVGLWLGDAVAAGIEDANAMVLATVSGSEPTTRVVLLKGIEDAGFVFYTNYESQKGKSIEKNPAVSLNFFWRELHRQIRIDGIASKVNGSVSDEYFLSRPELSRRAAWASPQSQEVPDRAYLDAKFNAISLEMAAVRPEHWGGYLVRPSRIEFWQGRENRLHDRVDFLLKQGSWLVRRLAP